MAVGRLSTSQLVPIIAGGGMGVFLSSAVGFLLQSYGGKHGVLKIKYATIAATIVAAKTSMKLKLLLCFFMSSFQILATYTKNAK